MTIEDMIFNGASEEEINEALNQIKKEKARQEEALRAEQEAEQKKIESNEALRVEGRAYLTNALMCYAKAFGLTDDDWTLEEVAKLEKKILQLEEMIPMYIRLIELQGKFDETDFFGRLF